jgi:TonB-dependent receptor
VDRYIGLLVDLRLIRRLPPWSENVGKRLVRAGARNREPFVRKRWGPGFRLEWPEIPAPMARRRPAAPATSGTATGAAGRAGQPPDSGGNPDAKPEKTRGVDLYWEYYPRRGGFMMVGAYYKDVRDVLFGSTRQFGLDILNSNGVNRADYVFSTTLNGGKGKVYGVEAALQLQLDNFLSEDHWWGGFGIQTNVSLNKSEAITPNGDKVRFPGTSDMVLNVGPYYEKYGFSARVSYQYRSSWIDGLGEPGVGGDFYWAADGELDVSARYAITKNIEVYADLSNLLNGPGRRFVGNDARSIERETFGRRFTGGFRVTY